ncbi:flagellar protein FliT [Paenibacillus sp. CGMCC 1.16610]|uniref:Flagellar protein FliT n=1 Tax=Paenibacillus anseongense TaxID=2682845 RepID=A0ABW9U629_9BACL|nr:MULTISPECIES: flagellar protein FliT [Paenibacillus]MBA2942401.1 flagellar protein FliT [Paenibacillus sp. CGMCC 1.16610]MVQ34476.1 hypothetical protein [Paenibacillus anseongense]
MDELISALDKVTVEMVSRIHEASYEDLEKFVDERGLIVDQIIPYIDNGLDKRQQAEINRIFTHDEVLRERMQQLRDEALLKIKQINQAKLQKKSYEYYTVTDSYFIDKKN